MRWGVTWIYLLAGAILVAIAWQDAATRIIPNRWLLLLLLCGGVNAVWDSSWGLAILGLFLCGAPILVASLVPKGGQIGGGDVKLCGVLGFLLGPVGGYMVILLALFLLSVYGLCRKKQALPFAPFVFPAYIIATLFLL